MFARRETRCKKDIKTGFWMAAASKIYLYCHYFLVIYTIDSIHQSGTWYGDKLQYYFQNPDLYN
jgi:hypothetical protein